MKSTILGILIFWISSLAAGWIMNDAYKSYKVQHTKVEVLEPTATPEWTGEQNKDHMLRLILTSFSELGDIVYLAEGTSVITGVDLDKATITTRLEQDSDVLTSPRIRNFKISIEELP